jgi:hypothetical protein
MIRLQYVCEKCGCGKHYMPSKHRVIICDNCKNEESLYVTHEVNYVSHRKLPLVTQFISGGNTNGEPTAHLTVEDYCKWYGAEIIRIDNTVERLHFEDFHGAIYGSDTVDHCINPSAFHSTAMDLNLIYDNRTFALVCERWVDDHLDGDWTQLHKYLPKSEEVVAPLVERMKTDYNHPSMWIVEPSIPETLDQIRAMREGHPKHKTGDFEGKGCEEEGKVFMAYRRSPTYEGTAEIIRPGEIFEILSYYDEGIYHLVNITRITDGDAYENEEGLRELIEPENKFTLEVVPKPGVLTANNRLYPEEVYRPAVGVYDELIKKGMVYARLGFPPYIEFVDYMITRLEDQQFRVHNIDSDTATLSPVSKDKYRLLVDLMTREKYVLTINSIGETEKNENGIQVVKNMNIVSFSIVPEKSVRRNNI